MFFPLPRNSPPGHFLFLVPASGHRRTGGRGSSQGSCPCKAFNRSRPLFFRQCAAFSDRAFSHPVRVQRALGYSAHFDFKLAPRTAIQALRPHCPDRRQNFHDSPLYGFAAFLAAFGRRCGYLFRSSRNCSHVVRPASSGDGRRWRQSVITENTQAFERQDRCPLHRHLPARHAFFAILHDTADSGTVSSASCSHGTRGRKENHRQACGVHGRGFASSSPHCAS